MCDFLQRKPSAVEVISLTLLRSKFENLLFAGLHNMCGLSLNSIDCFVIDITGNRYVIPGLDWFECFSWYSIQYTGNFIGPSCVICVTLPNQTLHRLPADLRLFLELYDWLWKM